jgi:integrase
VVALLATLNEDPERHRRTDWIERDRALILTALLAGLRADELVRANVGDLRPTDDGAVIHVRGKAGKESFRRSTRDDRCLMTPAQSSVSAPWSERN